MTGSRAPEITDDSVRERLLASASHLFAQKGYAATSVREIVEAAGVTKPVLYYYFGSKEGIYLELMNQALAEAEETIDGAITEGGTARERIERVCDRTFALILQNIDVVRVMDASYYGPPQGAPFFDFEAFHRAFEGTLRALVEEGMARGELRRTDPEMVTWAILGTLDVAKGIHFAHPDRSQGRKGLARLLDVVFQGALHSGDGSASR